MNVGPFRTAQREFLAYHRGLSQVLGAFRLVPKVPKLLVAERDDAFVRTRLVSRTTVGIDLGNARLIWQETSDYSTVG
jgi:hypothetical protein